MPLSLKTILKKFAHKGQITQEEYDALIKKLDGHDKEIRNKAIDEFAEKLKWEFKNSIGISNRVADFTTAVINMVAEQLKERD